MLKLDYDLLQYQGFENIARVSTNSGEQAKRLLEK
jgi:hypothetical protein